MDIQPIDIPRQAGIYVRRAREVQGLTRKQLAERSGVSERLLASLELGYAEGIRLDKLLAVLGALGINLLAQGDYIEKASFEAHMESVAASSGSDAGGQPQSDAASEGQSANDAVPSSAQSGDPWIQGSNDDAPRFTHRIRRPASRRKRKPVPADWSTMSIAAYDEMMRDFVQNDMGIKL